MSFFAELRRRHVLRVAAWYAAGAWLLIQVASTVIPEFDLPGWTVRAVIVAALLGFPVALLLAWAFDLTRAGITRATPAPLEQTAASPLRGLVSLLLAVAAGVLLTIGAITGWQALEAPLQPGPELRYWRSMCSGKMPIKPSPAACRKPCWTNSPTSVACA